MKILVCTTTVPYPPDGGGRADVWRRIEAFRQLGHRVMILYADSPRVAGPTPEQLAYMDSVVEGQCAVALDRRHAARQLIMPHGLPWHVATRASSSERNTAARLAAQRFEPEVVWLDGPRFGELAQQIARQCGARLFYRSHNIEFKYQRRQAAAASRLRNRVAWRLACVHLEAYEGRVMGAADRVFDISLDDMAFWQSRGITNISWLPPLPDLAFRESQQRRLVATDVLFVGNLRTPNNESGVRWLVKDVLPLLARARPGIRMTIVGSTPPRDLRRDLEANDQVDCYFDEPDVAPYLFGARVLVNPVAVGSGVQLKMLDMLMTDAPIVTRSQGVGGLPESVSANFVIADSAEDFAHAVLAQLESPTVDVQRRMAARRLFTVDALEEALAPRPDATGQQPQL